MHRQRAHGAFAIEAVADPQPGVPTIAAVPDALSKGAYTDSSLFRHCLSPSATTLTLRFPGPFSLPLQSYHQPFPSEFVHKLGIEPICYGDTGFIKPIIPRLTS